MSRAITPIFTPPSATFTVSEDCRYILGAKDYAPIDLIPGIPGLKTSRRVSITSSD